MPDGIPIILVAEDDSSTAGLIQIALQGDPCIVRRVSDGQACLDSVRREKPDLIVMDVMMPHVDGFSAAAALAEDPATREIPVLILTAKKSMRGAFDATPNIVEFMEKPFNPGDLAARVRGVLRRKH